MKHFRTIVAGIALTAMAALAVAPAFSADDDARPHGTLKLTDEDLALKLVLDKRTSVTIKPGKELKSPVGTVKPESLSLYGRDKKRRVWELSCYRSLGELRKIEIEDGETTELEVGPPIKVAVHLSQGKPQAGTKPVYLTLMYTGAAGESYSTAVKMNRRMAPAPKFEIENENGKRLHRGSFEYG